MHHHTTKPSSLLGLWMILMSLTIYLVGCDPEFGDINNVDFELGNEDQSLSPDQDEAPYLPDSFMDLSSPADQGGSNSPLSDVRGEGIFRRGCPRQGFAHARILTEASEIQGTAVIGGPGDILLMNSQAAFIIQDPTQASRTWWYYGGQIVDAIPIKDCMQAAPDRLNSLGMVVGEGQINALDQAMMRAFAGDDALIIKDGTDGGPIHVRILGHDAPMWLVEAELMSQAIKRGRPKLRSEELGVQIWVDYILEPDESLVHIKLGVTNLLGESRTLRMALLSFFGDEAEEQLFAPSKLEVGGIQLNAGIPWLSAGGMALAFEANQMATAHFAGVDIFIDLARFVGGDFINAFMGDDELDQNESIDRPDTTNWSINFALHERGLSQAAKALAAYHPTPSPLRDHFPIDLNVTLSPLPETEEFQELLLRTHDEDQTIHAQLEVWLYGPNTDNPEEDWVTLGQVGAYELPHPYVTDERVTLPLAPLALSTERYQLRYRAAGSPILHGPLFQLGEGLDPLPPESTSFERPMRGLLHVSVQDQMGEPIPATLRLTPINVVDPQQDRAYTRRPPRIIHIIETRSTPVAPGPYSYTLSRGFEYQPISGEVEVLPGEVTNLDLTLDHVNPTPHHIVFDGHVHAGPSPDSDISVWRRLRGAAAEGLDIVAGSDHEIIIDWWQVLAPEQRDQLDPWIRSILAEEATATLPEHMNIYPLSPRPEHPRGDPPLWYGLGFDAFTGALRDRGAPIIQLNHPRQGCNYLCIIEYDRIRGEPTTLLSTDYFGYEEGEIWGWNFNAVELLNGPRALFIDPDRPKETGFFEDWASFINHGHRVTAMGVTDVHGLDKIGLPVSLVELDPLNGDITPQEATPDRIAASIVAGKVQVSLGAWVDVKLGDVGLGELAPTFRREDDPDDDLRWTLLDATVYALPEVDVTWVYLMVNCDVRETWSTSTPDERIKLHIEQELSFEEDAWISLVAFGETSMPQGLRTYDPRVTPRVITNAIYVDGNGDGIWQPPGDKSCLIPEGRSP